MTRRQFASLLIGLIALMVMPLDGAEKYRRNMTERKAFIDAHPCPGVTDAKGACVGYVVDHVVPLCACAGDKRCLKKLDHRINMAWQKVGYGPGLADLKDEYEIAACAAIRRTVRAARCDLDPDEDKGDPDPDR